MSGSTAYRYEQITNGVALPKQPSKSGHKPVEQRCIYAVPFPNCLIALWVQLQWKPHVSSEESYPHCEQFVRLHKAWLWGIKTWLRRSRPTQCDVAAIMSEKIAAWVFENPHTFQDPGSPMNSTMPNCSLICCPLLGCWELCVAVISRELFLVNDWEAPNLPIPTMRFCNKNDIRNYVAMYHSIVPLNDPS